MNLNKLAVRRIYRWLSKAADVRSGNCAVVFGRKDPRLAIIATDLAAEKCVDGIIFTGGTGKDSGDLAMPEAEYLFQLLDKARIPDDVQVFVEDKATNGVENAKLSMQVAHQQQLRLSVLLAVAHGPSARRLARTLRHFARKQARAYGVRPKVYAVPTQFEFDPTNPKHRMEIWYEFGWMIGFPVFVRNPRVLKMYMNCYGWWLRKSQN